MNLSLKASSRISIFVSAIAYTALTFGTAVAPAPLSAQGGAYYTATLAQPAEDDRAVAGGVAWACEGTTCVANKGTSRPMRICRGLAREFGEITSFKTEGEELAEDKLAKCNGN
ncbi:CC_3452 family protein [Erythrobacter sp. GH1-10]|uniref:CC_3452 family protein n=1 Tax=Erythrobacter sp. GH1-10 TaxID=3349334 RepID=UPI003877C111